MRFVWLAAIAAFACSADHAPGGGGNGSGSGSDDPNAEICSHHCVVNSPPRDWTECCDSTTCYIDPDTGKWQVVSCDPPAPDPCAACGATELCVARYDGTCQGRPSCVPKTVDCPANACSSECQAAYCPQPYQCQDRVPCGGEPAAAFTCYGP
jgi:hypothetical protein